MYNPKRNNHSFGKYQRGFNSSRLDPRLFVREATESGGQKEKTNALFSQYGIADKLKRNIAERGYSNPTEIQEKTIPYILESKDVIGVANTGTGKTAAFLVPLINKSFHDRNQRVLIVVPTRELAVQIADELRIFAKGMDIEAVLSIGGVSIRRQMHALRHNPHFVIGTPGRLKDLIERRLLNLMLFQNVVLDEVDRMVDIGFIKDIQYLISLLPKIRQSLFFSATVDGKTREILQSFVTNPITVSVKHQDTGDSIDQDVIRVTRHSKLDTLHNLLMQKEFHKVLIFGRTKWGMEKLARSLTQRGFKAAAIHGNKSQNQRQRALQEFKKSQIQVLIATDVASRGIDIDDVTHVINYDEPASYTDYIHRIGRTGRAGKRGTALTFIE
ncbi:MAG: DEAD/DEAH box helicase [Candidatus Levybacteria bacterium]|nr:DEAD/DEAH box helicase [Candidatus Levybacteria bacterium]